MALRDSSQKVTFIYTDLYKVYKKAKDASPITSESARVFRADEAEALNAENYQPPRLATVTIENGNTMVPRSSAFEDLRANINKLNDLHSKLRFMLKELEDLVSKK